MKCSLIVLSLLLSTPLGCSGDDASSAGAGSPDGASADGTDTAAGPGAGGASTTSGAGASGSGAAGAGGGDPGSGGGAVGDPPCGSSSKGSGGPAPVNGSTMQAGSVTYSLIVPGSYSPGVPTPLLIVYSGTEGGAAMTQNLLQVASITGTSTFIEAVLDGVDYNGDGAAGATVLDALRDQYDVDNDRTYLLGESAGTTAAFQLGFHLRQSYFAAYWANDVNAADGPESTAAALGFQPWGQVGPGGDHPDATQIVAAMTAADYRLPTPAPYAGPGADQHGNPQQFIAAVSWFQGKSRM